MKRVNKSVGARVIVREVLVEISPSVGWRNLKKVYGTIVERSDHEQYYHTSSGGYNYVTKFIIKDDVWPNYAIKLDDNIVDIEGNNIIVFREFDLKFIDRIEIKTKPVTEKQYLAAKKIIERYENN